jgi:hypothetical protein
MTSKTLDNSNPTVHATLSQAHAEKPVSQSALLANVWKTSNDDPQEQDSDMEWVKSAVSQEETGKPLAFTENMEREDIDELEVFGEQTVTRKLCITCRIPPDAFPRTQICCDQSPILSIP